MPLSWIVAGSAATSGLFWLALAALRSASLGQPTLVIAAIASAFASGALLASHAPVKPTREPLLGGVIGCGVVYAAQLALAHAHGWQRAYADPVWLQILSLLFGAASGAAGAAVVRRLKGVSASAPSIMMLSAAVTVGVALTCGALSSIVGFGETGGVLAVLGGIVVAGFVTQLAVPVHAPWLSASGIMLLPVLQSANGRSDEPLYLLILGCLIFVPFGRLGSQLAIVRVPKPNASDLPAARASGP